MRVIDKLNKGRVYADPIVTEVIPLENYYPAEDYHQDYYKNNQSAPYCMLVIKPKLDKIK